MKVLLHHSTMSRVALTAALMMSPACRSDEAAHAAVSMLDRTTQALASGELVSINGTYGPGCWNRAGAWSVEVVEDAILDHPGLSVVVNNEACALTLTELHTADVIIPAVPPILLTTSYKLLPSSFGTPVELYANATVSTTSFADDFLLTILYSDDPSLATRVNIARRVPTVIANTPLAFGLNASIGTRPTATFSMAMDPLSITELTFIMKQELTLIAGEVSYDSATRIAMFTPEDALGLDLLYEVTVTTGAEDLTHAGLPKDHVWTFRTAASSQAPIKLGAASGFVILAGSSVTNTGPTSITGDLGLSPGTSVTGFPPGVLFGTQHAGNALAALAMIDLNTAYDEAAGRTLDPISVSGNLGGRTLTPGLYKSGSSLEVSTGDLVLDALGDVDAVFLFQMATTFLTTSNRQVVLSNGARAANVYWQVGSSATLGTNSVVHGTIMADQSITLTDGATLHGRALARNAAITMDTNTIVGPSPL